MTLRERAIELFKKHWELKTDRECDDMILDHMSYCIDAIEEGLNDSLQYEILHHIRTGNFTIEDDK